MSLSMHTTYNTIADMKAGAATEETHAFCMATGQWYRYEADGGAYTPDDLSVAITSNGGNTRWLAVGAQYGLLTDTTINNASIDRHGFTPKLPDDAAQFLNGIGGWSSPVTAASMETFGAAMMLDLSADPATGYVTSSGYISDAVFDVVGSWSRVAPTATYVDAIPEVKNYILDLAKRLNELPRDE